MTKYIVFIGNSPADCSVLGPFSNEEEAWKWIDKEIGVKIRGKIVYDNVGFYAVLPLKDPD
jgi:hypothetical protein